MKKIISTLIALSFCLFSMAKDGENVTQTIRGTVKDVDSKSPIIGATIVLLNSQPLRGAVSDLDGHFNLSGVPIGRVSIKISSLGYEDKFLNNIQVGSGRELVLSIELVESLVSIDEVVVSQKKHKSEVLNEMAIISARAFSVEETERFAGSLNDPARMVSAFAGVTGDAEGNNSIVVRGNSSRGIQWRLEGVEIPSPNHFSDEGMTGGPINALNSDMLANSDFYTGAFAPEYGNAFSGVFDMRLRNGNPENREHYFGISGIGLDASTEGPLSIGKNASYIANYRYSSIGLLSDLGVVNFGGIPRYQDLSYKFNIPTAKAGSFSVFGLGGKSAISGEELDDNEVATYRDDYNSWIGVTGLNHTYFYTKNIFQRTSLSVSSNGSGYYGEDLDEETNTFVWDNEDEWNTLKYKLATRLNVKFNANHLLQIGGEYTYTDFKFISYYMEEDSDIKTRYLDVNGDSETYQTFVSWKYRMNNDITMVSGVHGTYSALSDEFIVEPRFGMQWQVNPKHSLNIGYGAHSQQNPLPIHFSTHTTYDTLANNEVMVTQTTPNRQLEVPRAHHFVAGYDYRISKNMHAKFEVYYQYLYNIGVGSGNDSIFSLLTFDGTWSDVPLVNKGTGKNYGIEMTMERYFVDDYYFLITGSLYQSKYTDINGVERNTRFNGNYAANALVGKEWSVGDPSKNRTLSINTKVTLIGGRKIIPIDLDASIEKGETVRDVEHAFDQKLDDVFQFNFGASLRRDRERTTHEFKIDIQNATNNLARTGEYYWAEEEKIEYSEQLGIIPNIIYRIYF